MTYPEKIDSKFRYVLLASQRAEQMMRGAVSKLEKPIIDVLLSSMAPTVMMFLAAASGGVLS